MKPKGLFAYFGIVILMLMITALALVLAYSGVQLRVAKKTGVYQTPEEGLYALIAKDYHDVKKVEIARADREVFNHLCFVKAYVYAASRSDGSDLPARGYDHTGRYFARVKKGWVLISEVRFPEIIALGQWLLHLS